MGNHRVHVSQKEVPSILVSRLALSCVDDRRVAVQLSP